MKKMDDFRYKGKSSRATAKSTPFAVSKDEWDTKETGKSMKNALYVLYCGMPKGTCPAEVTSNSEALALAAIELCLSEGISQLLSQSVTKKFLLFKKKIRSNFLKAFQVDLKACLGLFYLFINALQHKC